MSRRAAVAALALAAAVATGGCRMNEEGELVMPVPTPEEMKQTHIDSLTVRSEEEAREALDQGLRERYGEEFALVGDGPRAVDWLYDGEVPFVFLAEYAPASDPSKVFRADVSARGDVQDDYAQYLFKDEVERRCGEAIAGSGFQGSFEAELAPLREARVWREGDSLEEYMGGTSLLDPWVDVSLYPAGGSEEEQAAEVKKALDSLYDVGFWMDVRAYDPSQSEWELFIYRFEAHTEHRLSEERVIDKIRGEKRSWPRRDELAAEGAAEEEAAGSGEVPEG
ncbi:hypothetical protein B5F40_00840 [Gordonibacter sp. An230]|uniref:hypothetical protein n=1 Tax=Gordonibacter sp. An230 TaxID=1965592 RepID=UPI000B3B004E|nr:hypothetical protein [Gordonibacter sp. An230]OUO92477.1 hypothetical protein B5F40_00840 [Gordonibacter sp. An230]